MEGGYFLLQHVDLDHAGHPVKGIEVIGYGRDWEGRAPKDCTSHFFDNDGNHFEYIYEVGDDGTVTIWGGYVGSPAAFRARISEDKQDDHRPLGLARRRLRRDHHPDRVTGSRGQGGSGPPGTAQHSAPVKASTLVVEEPPNDPVAGTGSRGVQKAY